MLFEDEAEGVRVTRWSNNGRLDPEHIDIEVRQEGRPFRWSRRLKVTVDELFVLTDALEDVCDAIEDAEEEEGDRG